ncbi:MAG: sulfide/dihydroorotate dehydrogenase-like FAD/NAD-binding protein [Bacteroidales bacterium]|nr:sulfide/dihydroorotate dehydrogenase-like FAD/NAD-binding protein [Candidatus Hennigimonas equi]
MFKILKKQFLTSNICRMEVEAPLVANAAKPGQFLMVRADEKGERIPLTISDYDAVAGTVTIVTQTIGASTTKINSMEEGECFADVVGPLGNPSEFIGWEKDRIEASRFVFLAGGVGSAPVYPQAKWLREHGANVTVILGARTRDLLIYTDELGAVSDELQICTDDGSYGFQGNIPALLEHMVKEEGRKYTDCVAIGPMIMMKFSVIMAEKLNLPVTVSLNTLMVDGTGMCGACRVTVDGKTRFACVDGPEFDGTKVDFDEAMRRQKQYVSQERGLK